MGDPVRAEREAGHRAKLHSDLRGGVILARQEPGGVAGMRPIRTASTAACPLNVG